MPDHVEAATPLEVVAIGVRAYPHATFLAAMNTVALERIERALAAATTMRRVGRNLAAIKTPAVAAEIRAEAIRRTIATTPVADEVEAVMVARFPWPEAV